MTGEVYNVIVEGEGGLYELALGPVTYEEAFAFAKELEGRVVFAWIWTNDQVDANRSCFRQ